MVDEVGRWGAAKVPGEFKELHLGSGGIGVRLWGLHENESLNLVDWVIGEEEGDEASTRSSLNRCKNKDIIRLVKLVKSRRFYRMTLLSFELYCHLYTA